MSAAHRIACVVASFIVAIALREALVGSQNLLADEPAVALRFDALVPDVADKEDGKFEHDGDAHLAINFKELHQRFGIILTKERDPRNPEKNKRLTYAQDGSYNNTCIRIDGYENLFGQNPGEWLRDKQGLVKQRELVNGRRWVSAWRYPQQVVVTQTIAIVPNDASKKLDTCLIHYLVENADRRAHTVGLRVMMDTYVGASDGVPVLVPSREGLLETKINLANAKDVPDFIQAIENPDLLTPGTVAHVGLVLPAGLRLNEKDPDLEPVTRLVISRFPGNPEMRWDYVEQGKFWDMNDKSKGQENDSCVAVYWEYRKLEPGEKRAMAFTIGLGQLSSVAEKNARLGLTYGGRPQPGKEITVSAWLRDAKQDQKVRLELPVGLSLASGEQAEKIGKGVGRLSQCSWRVAISEKAKPDRYKLEAKSDDAKAQLDVRVRSSFDGLLR